MIYLLYESSNGINDNNTDSLSNSLSNKDNNTDNTDNNDNQLPPNLQQLQSIIKKYQQISTIEKIKIKLETSKLKYEPEIITLVEILDQILTYLHKLDPQSVDILYNDLLSSLSSIINDIKTRIDQNQNKNKK